MSTLCSNEYGQAVKAIQESPLFTHIVYKTHITQGKRIIDLTRAEILANDIMHPDGGATSRFMRAAGDIFRDYEKGNPTYEVKGFRAIGTVAEALLSTWRSTRALTCDVARISEEELDKRLATENISKIMVDSMDQRIAENEERSK